MENVMLVSNQLLSRKAIKKIVAEIDDYKVGYEINNLKEGISLIQSEKVDIVLLESIPLYLDNSVFIEEARKRKVKIFLIARANELSKEEIKNFDFDDIILKPINKKIITQKLLTTKEDEIDIDESLLKEIEDIISKDNFIKIYDFFRENMKNIFTDDMKILKNRLYYIGDKIFEKKIIYDESVSKVFPIKKSIKMNEQLAFLWLFYVIEYSFKKFTIREYPILENVFKYIENHMSENISLKDVVKECAISQGYLSRLFKTNYNLTVLKYIHLKKINYAKKLFVLEDLSAQEVAFQLGYNERGYFSKVFKKNEHITIEQYKQIR